MKGCKVKWTVLVAASTSDEAYTMQHVLTSDFCLVHSKPLHMSVC